MSKMIESTIELGRMDAALKMMWAEMAYEYNNGDVDVAVEEFIKIQKGE